MTPLRIDLFDIAGIFSKRFVLVWFWILFLRQVSGAAVRPAVPAIGAPFDSLKRTELHDSFNEIHHGHRQEAIDIMKPRGTPILAVSDGTIEKLFHSVPGGLTIYEFDNSGTYCFYYAHLDHYAAGLYEHMKVSRGQVIGYVGTSGNAEANAPQLHFAINRLDPRKRWWKGDPIDPYPILLRAVGGEELGAVPQESGLPWGCRTSSEASKRAEPLYHFGQ
jgi:murein DD-endopeptidase MepM/ murein hydrolase activator NlpD